MNKNKYKIIIIILIISIILGGFLIYKGLSNSKSKELKTLKAEEKMEYYKNGKSEKYYKLHKKVEQKDNSVVYYFYGAGLISLGLIGSINLYIINKKKKIKK